MPVALIIVGLAIIAGTIAQGIHPGHLGHLLMLALGGTQLLLGYYCFWFIVPYSVGDT
jgi:hypothetical protein